MVNVITGEYIKHSKQDISPPITNTNSTQIEQKISNPPQTSSISTEYNNDNTGMVDPERKDAIPLLIIDVNIRPGVKKKIYVFEGDTADGLAEKFSKEHSNLLY
jgi:hypothetical protein